MRAANGGTGLEYCFVIPFLIVWLTFLMLWLAAVGSYLNLVWRGAPTALERWAKEGGHRIARQERRRFFKGPFFWNSSNCQIIYRVEVHDRDGSAKVGWVCIGRYWWPSAGRIEVRWDETRPAPLDEGSGPPRGNPLMWDRELDP